MCIMIAYTQCSAAAGAADNRVSFLRRQTQMHQAKIKMFFQCYRLCSYNTATVQVYHTRNLELTAEAFVLR